MNATPTPWRIATQTSYILCENREQTVTHILLPDGRKVLCPDAETADLIIRAVNSYDAMREALGEVVQYWEEHECPIDKLGPQAPLWIKRVKAALALADGKEGG
jgi:hypothetical protein